MPEFILDRGSPQGAKLFAGLDSFTQGYIEAMFFTSEGEGNGYGESDSLRGISFAELAPVTLERICTDCEAFQQANAGLLAQAYGACVDGDEYDDQRAGNDYWYSRNGHGTGFWDRGLGAIGDDLNKAAGRRELNLYRGDDGQLYLD